MGYYLGFVVFHLVTLAIVIPLAVANQAVAKVKNAEFVGESNEINKNYYASFKGVKYGNALRFKKPTPHQYSQGQFHMKSPGSVCPQVTKGYDWVKNEQPDEDCLFLNIYVPLSSSDYNQGNVDLTKKATKKAVFVFIHGGVFERGNSNKYDPYELSAMGDVIVVTFNYRVGVFGFLTTDNDKIPANLGLHDQRLAIKWVYDNIEKFSGDTSRITLGGDSAGSFSAIIHAVNPRNDKYFQNILAHSGSAFTKGVVVSSGADLKQKVANVANCKNQDVLTCLKSKTVDEIVKITAQIPQNTNGALTFGPVRDNDIITGKMFRYFNAVDKPRNVLDSFTQKNLLMGFNQHDGDVVYAMMASHLAKLTALADINISVDEALKKFFHPLDTKSQASMISLLVTMLSQQNPTPQVIQAIVKEYNGASNNITDITRSLNNLAVLTDVFFALPAIHTAKLHNETSTCQTCSHGRTYVFKFKLPEQQQLRSSFRLKWFKGTGHEAMLRYVMEPFDRYTDGSVRYHMIDTLTGFFKNSKLNGKEFSYRNVIEMSTQNKDVPFWKTAKVAFWNGLFQQLQNSG